MNPHPRDELRDGGTLRLPVDSLPGNFNPLQIDGAKTVTYQIAEAILPTAFKDMPDGGSVPHTSYFDDITMTSVNPQVVRYRINPRAVWSNGRGLSWEDLRDQWQALRGTDARYEVTNHVGYSDVATIERGGNDQEAIVTYERPFADWKALYRPLVPREITATPEAFNTAWRDGPQVTAGPFEVERVDRTAKTLTLRRSPRWWNDAAPLDHVVFRVLDAAARAEELANGGIDIAPIGADVDLYRRAQSMADVQIRSASERLAGEVAFNGMPQAVLSDLSIRKAVSQAINAQQITDVVVGPITTGAQAVGNHILPPSHSAYRDNRGLLPFDPAAASKALDEAGWIRNGTDLRSKGGTPLSLRIVSPQTPAGKTTTALIADQLKQVGVGSTTTLVASDKFSSDYVKPGLFDLLVFEWTKSPYPISHDRSVFQTPSPTSFGNNFGRVDVPGVQALYDRALVEVDPARTADLVQQIDELVWNNAHHLPLYPGTGAYAVRSSLANFGARGLGSYGFAQAGFVK